MPDEPLYPHRMNRDGTWDSICNKCFLTIAHCKTESELAAFEKTHICYSSLLAEEGYYYSVPRAAGARRTESEIADEEMKHVCSEADLQRLVYLASLKKLA